MHANLGNAHGPVCDMLTDLDATAYVGAFGFDATGLTLDRRGHPPRSRCPPDGCALDAEGALWVPPDPERNQASARAVP